MIKGNESSQDEKAASAINAVKLDDEVGGKAIQVRVVQGMEPRHFIKMFGGKMIVFTGGKVILKIRNFISHIIILLFEVSQFVPLIEYVWMFLKATGFKNMERQDSYDTDGTALFRVRGTCPEDVMTTQIQPECVRKILLNSKYKICNSFGCRYDCSEC